MDVTQSLDDLGNILTELADKPLDPTIHARHIKHVQSAPGMEMEHSQACEMMVQLLAAGDEVWLPLLKVAEEQNLDASESVENLLSLYKRAESDYLCMLIWKHIRLMFNLNQQSPF